MQLSVIPTDVATADINWLITQVRNWDEEICELRYKLIFVWLFPMLPQITRFPKVKYYRYSMLHILAKYFLNIWSTFEKSLIIWTMYTHIFFQDEIKQYHSFNESRIWKITFPCSFSLYSTYSSTLGLLVMIHFVYSSFSE